MEEIREIPCPSCGEPVLEEAEFCPACFASPSGSPGTAGDGDGDVDEKDSEPAEAVAAPREIPLDLAPDPETPRCPEHPARPIATTCERCGRFLCVDCEPRLLRREKLTCRRCLETEHRLAAPERIRRVVWELVGGHLLVALGLASIFILPLLAGTHADVDVTELQRRQLAQVFLFAGGFLGLPFLILAAVVLFTRSYIAAWVGFGLQALLTLFLTLFALADGGNFGLLVWLVLAHGLLRCVELTSLSSLLRRAARPAASV